LLLALSGTRRLGMVQLAVPVTAVGAGCAGSAGVPALAVAGPPRIGARVMVSVSGTAAPIGVLAFGFSDALWNGNALPLALAPYGAPGCFVHVAWEALFLTVPPAPVHVDLPPDPQLDGFLLFAQWALLADPSGLAVVTSAGARLRVIGL
jgi:hypothetical protein